MKIAIEAQRLFRKKKHGMDIVALELIRHLQQIDRENEYFILVKPDIDNTVLSETDNFHIIEISGGPYPLWEQYYLPKALKTIRPDILHCTSNTAPLSVNIPLIVTLHDILFMKKVNFINGSLYQRLGNAYRRWIVPKIVSNCQQIITVSNFEKREIERYFLLKTGIVKTIYNAYNEAFGRGIDQRTLEIFKEKFNLPDHFLLYLGNTDPKKNIRNVLRAFLLYHQNSKEKLHLVMPDVSKDYLSSILKEMKAPQLDKAIHLPGYIPNDELVHLYQQSSLFLYPSFYESFGIPILEAMASGTPVITSNTSAIPEIAAEAAVLVNPACPEDIASAIQKLILDKNVALTYRELGLKRAAFYNWEHTAMQVHQIYKTILKNEDHFHYYNKFTI